MSASNPYAPPRGAVEDISAGEDLELAGRAVRLAAAIADGLIVCFMVYAPAVIVLAAMGGFSEPEVQDDAVWIATGTVFFAGAVAWAWITVLLVARHGQTMGKRLLEIRVVRSDGSKASLGRIFWLRNFVNGLLGIIPLYSIVDPLLIFGARRQCIHDLIADTIVVQA